jgi:predicted small metal-binding protein
MKAGVEERPMNEQPSELRYECLEAGCSWTTEAGSEEQLLDAVNKHMADAHDTFELEDVIIDNAVATTAEGSVEAKESE